MAHKARSRFPHIAQRRFLGYGLSSEWSDPATTTGAMRSLFEGLFASGQRSHATQTGQADWLQKL